jgi:hypothetical protein
MIIVNKGRATCVYNYLLLYAILTSSEIQCTNKSNNIPDADNHDYLVHSKHL